MRVIAGSAGGLRLEVPKGDVRPTMDRVKAAIFSSLAERIPGANVLDLFAGSGGLGIEALSRGAANALFIDSSRSATETIARNLTTTKLRGEVRASDVFEFLRHANGAYNLIMADPPYEPGPGGERFSDVLLQHPRLPGLLTPDDIFVLEKRPEEAMPETSYWKVTRARRYGATEVLFLQKAE